MLIFGGTGFVGRHLCSALFSSGQKATVVSRAPDKNFVASMSPLISALTLEEFQANETDLLEKHNTIIYAASRSVPGTFIGSPWLEYEENVQPAMQLFCKASQINKDMRIVFISSGGTIYGTHHTHPIKEDAPVEPISPYGLGKATIEQGLEYLGRTRDLDYRILRVSNPFGRWQSNPKQGIIPIAINAIQNDKPIVVFGQGHQVRDFIDADDLAEGILSAARSENCKQSILNIGSGHGITISEVFTMLEETLGRILKKESLPKRASDVTFSVLDCTRAKMILGWEAKTPLYQSVEKFINQQVEAQAPL